MSTKDETKSSLFNRIATELYDPEQLLKAIEEQAVRERPETRSEYVAPRTPLEERLAEFCAQVLGVERIGVNDSFFESGGHSLLATQLLARVHEAYGVELPLHVMFEAPTVALLAGVVESAIGSNRNLSAPIVRVARGGNDLPLSFAQQRLWFLDQLDPNAPYFNVPAAVQLSGRLDVRALEQSLNEIVRRHESLRTTFAARDGLPAQHVAPELTLKLAVTDLGALPAAERTTEVTRLASEEALTPFDLAVGPLVRARLLRLSDDEHVALFTMHHIISDGWSMGVLIREVAALYEAFSHGAPSPLAELPIQYADYAAWQREHLSGAALEAHLDYWRQQLAGAPAVLELPTDRPRPAAQSYRGAHHPVILDLELSEGVRSLSRQQGVTLFMTLLAAFDALLFKYTNRADVVAGSDVANRPRAEVEGLIGFFVNQLVLRTDLSGDPTFTELLGRVRATTLGAYAHQDVPFDKVVEAVNPERDPGHTPLVQVKLVLQGAPMQTPEMGGVARMDMTLLLTEEATGHIAGSVEYNSDIFEAATIGRMLQSFEVLLREAVARPDIKLGELVRAVDEAERGRQSRERNELAASNRQRFKSVKRKVVDLSRAELVETGNLLPGEPLPLCVRPADKNVDLADWARNNTSLVEESLSKHGAMLFRGFPVDSPAAFEQFARAITPELYNDNGEHPRETVSGEVYTPVFYPRDKMLLWHNENSFNLHWPLKIWFCCLRPAEQGGETPVVDSRRVFDLLDPAIKHRFIEKGVMYMRNYGEGPGLSWQTVFGTMDKAEVEEKCRRNGMTFEWKENDGLRTRCVRPAVINHPRTGEASWFNQAQHWHVSCLEPAVRESLQSMLRDEDLPRNCYYGDGSAIEDSVMSEILDVYRGLEVSFPWQQGDILMLDNVLTAHARRPFAGERKLLVAMGEMRGFDEV
jgi:non-ribosomal peptide synthetase component F/alpha-ketoglutarate-dependent taurine dioxygenase/acyl carrier protein